MARLINPLSGMFLLVAVYLAYTVVMIAYGEYASEEAYSVFAFGFMLLLMWWVYRDGTDAVTLYHSSLKRLCSLLGRSWCLTICFEREASAPRRCVLLWVLQYFFRT